MGAGVDVGTDEECVERFVEELASNEQTRRRAVAAKPGSAKSDPQLVERTACHIG